MKIRQWEPYCNISILLALTHETYFSIPNFIFLHTLFCVLFLLLFTQFNSIFFHRYNLRSHLLSFLLHFLLAQLLITWLITWLACLRPNQCEINPAHDQLWNLNVKWIEFTSSLDVFLVVFFADFLCGDFFWPDLVLPGLVWRDFFDSITLTGFPWPDFLAALSVLSLKKIIRFLLILCIWQAFFYLFL